MQRTRRRGLTFLEVEIALLLLMLSVLAVIEISPLSTRGILQAERHERAQQFAQAILENEMARSFASVYTTTQSVTVGNIVSANPGATDVMLPGAPLNTYSYRVIRAPHPNAEFSTTSSRWATYKSNYGVGSYQYTLMVITVQVWWYGKGSTPGTSSSTGLANADRYVQLVGYKSFLESGQ